MEAGWAIVVAILPSIGVGYLFYKVIRTIVESDRNERLAHSRWEAQQDAREQDAQRVRDAELKESPPGGVRQPGPAER